MKVLEYLIVSGVLNAIAIAVICIGFVFLVIRWLDQLRLADMARKAEAKRREHVIRRSFPSEHSLRNWAEAQKIVDELESHAKTQRR